MAVSGREISDLKGQVSTSSSADFQLSCVPCLSDGQHEEAHGFCGDCHEYLCKTCLHCHKKNKASKHHQLLDIDKVGQQVTTGRTSDVCTEKCSVHRNEVIKFFCPKHEELGCTDCMTMKHRTCDLDYIPDKCAGIGDSEEYKDTMEKLDQEIRKGDDVVKRAENKNIEIDDWYNKVIKDIMEHRKEINDHLDAIQQKVEVEAENRRSTDKQEIKTLLDSLDSFTSEMKKLKSDLRDLKEQVQNSDIFIAVKRSKSRLESKEEIQSEKVLDETPQLLFECNRDLEHILSIDSFGKLTNQLTRAEATSSSMLTKTSPTKPIHAQERKQMFYTLYDKGDINIRTQTDILPCDISGCAVLPSYKILLTDYQNKKLKVVNTLTKEIVEEKQLDSHPFDVTVLTVDEIAVTMPDKGEILIIRTAGQLSTSRSLKVQGRCRGISYHQDRLYVVCGKPNCVYILDMKGNVKSKISFEDKTAFSMPRYIAFNKDKTLLYISDVDKHTVASATEQGKISAVNTSIGKPSGMVMLDDGSLLVCSFYGSIYYLQADMKQSYEVFSGLKKPGSICWSPAKSEVYAGCENCDQLKVFSLQ